MKATYDLEADAAYFYLKDIGVGEASQTYCCDPSEVDGMINLDFDSNGHLLGIEVLDASKKLSAETLKNIIGNSK